jgi:hypothetical protein
MLVIEFVLSQISGVKKNIYWLLVDFTEYKPNGPIDVSDSHSSVYNLASHNAEAIGIKS